MAPELYRPIYLLIVTILTYFVCRRYYDWGSEDVVVEEVAAEREHKLQIRYASLLAIFMTLFIGLRPIRGHFVDMYNYKVNYMALYYGKSFKFSWDTDNYLFDNLTLWLGSNQIDLVYFFLFMAILYFGLMYWACRKMFPNDTLLSFLVYLAAFSTFSYGTNGIKAGAAASMFLVALAYRENWKIAALFCFLSLGFHHSMLVPIVAFVLASFSRTPSNYLLIWLLCLFLAAIHVTDFMVFFSGFTDERGAHYLVDDVENAALYVSGFRPDFILYSAVPIFLGYYYIQNQKIESDTYNYLWCTYTLTNSVFLLCTYGHFINRIAYLSWLMYPFVLIYPVLYGDSGVNQQRYLKYAVYGHLGFTLFNNLFL